MPCKQNQRRQHEKLHCPNHSNYSLSRSVGLHRHSFGMEGLIMSTLKALETSLYWQQVVLKQSRDPKQKARVSIAIERLTAQIQALKNS